MNRAPDPCVADFTLEAETRAGSRALGSTPACDVDAIVVRCRMEGATVAAGLLEQLEPVFVMSAPRGERRAVTATIVRAAGSNAAQLQATFSGSKLAEGDFQLELRVAGLVLATLSARLPGRVEVQDDLELAELRIDAIGAASPTDRVLVLEHSPAVAVRVAVAPRRFLLTGGYPVRGLIQLVGEARATISSVPFTLDPEAATVTYRTREPIVVPLPPRAGEYRVVVALVPRLLAEEKLTLVSRAHVLASARVVSPRFVLLGAAKAMELGNTVDRADLEGKLVLSFGLDTSRAFLAGVRAPVALLVTNDAGELLVDEESEIEVDRPLIESVRIAVPLVGLATRVVKSLIVHLLIDGHPVDAHEVVVSPPLVTFNGEGAIVGEVAGAVTDEVHAACLDFFGAAPRARRKRSS